MKILITGGAGFIGYHLASKFIKENNNVTLIDNLHKTGIDNELKILIEEKNIQLLELNLDNPASLEDLDDDFEIFML